MQCSLDQVSSVTDVVEDVGDFGWDACCDFAGNNTERSIKLRRRAPATIGATKSATPERSNAITAVTPSILAVTHAVTTRPMKRHAVITTMTTARLVRIADKMNDTEKRSKAIVKTSADKNKGTRTTNAIAMN